MRHFAIAALAAAHASAEYSQMTITVDGSERTKYFKGQSFGTVDQPSSDSVRVHNNNNILIKDDPYDGENFAFKPWIRGGSIEYTVDLSSQDCGCVAGVYAVAVNPDLGCGTEDPTGSKPHCPSIDIMQANPYGFNTAAHPCANGTCDALSQCQYNMAVEGKAFYGDDAYGPNGTMINTNNPFTVKTEFLSHNSY